MSDLDTMKSMLYIGKRMKKTYDAEFSRDVTCVICRDYHVLANYPRRMHKQNLLLCSCEGARSSELVGKKVSITTAMEKGNMKCVNCGKQIVVFDELDIKTNYDGDKFLLIYCNDCKDESNVNLEKRIHDLEIKIKAKEGKSDKPTMTFDEMVERMKRRDGA